MKFFPAAILLASLVSAAVADAAPSQSASSGNCHIGSYRLSDNAVVDIGPGDGAHLRWRRVDGTTGLLTKGAHDIWTSTLGWTGRDDGHRVRLGACRDGAITFDTLSGLRIAFDVSETRFQGAGVSLMGRLVMPKSKGPVPIVVLVHGSEHDSARNIYALQRMFPAAGIGAFVYDKRGTGGSKGEYTQNYLLLAEDAIAAVHEARRLAGARAGRVGYQAGSQGGWVAPLAALIEPVDFVIVGFGLAVSPLDEDRSAIALDLSRRGFGKDAMDKAMQIADASREILVSGFTSGFDRLKALRDKYSHEFWFKYVHGDVTFFLLEMPEAKVRIEGPKLLAGAPFYYDPMPVLRRVDVPQLWILAADDTEAPSAETVRRLKALQSLQRPIDLAVFPRTDHGIYEYESTPDGTRTSTRNPDGYFAMMRNFIQTGRVGDHYGTASISHHK